jgi:hypothetical protein
MRQYAKYREHYKITEHSVIIIEMELTRNGWECVVWMASSIQGAMKTIVYTKHLSSDLSMRNAVKQIRSEVKEMFYTLAKSVEAQFLEASEDV